LTCAFAGLGIDLDDGDVSTRRKRGARWSKVAPGCQSLNAVQTGQKMWSAIRDHGGHRRQEGTEIGERVDFEAEQSSSIREGMNLSFIPGDSRMYLSRFLLEDVVVLRYPLSKNVSCQTT